MQTTGVRAGLYRRQSQDDGDTLAIERQEDACRNKAADLGWTITDVYTDQGKSASKKSVRRPEYERMLADARAGRINAVVAWSHDRLTRQPEQLGAWLDLADTGFKIATVAGELDLGSSSGRATGRILAAIAEQEGRAKSERQRLKNQQRSANGGSLNRTRPFGYLASGMELHPEESVLLANAIRDVLAGTATINSLVRTWRQSGIKTSYGKEWHNLSVKRTLCRWRNAGVAAWHEDKPDEVLSEAKWPAVCTREELEALRQLVRDPSRRPVGHTGTTVRNYLSYLARCGVCTSPLVAGKRRGITPIYRCLANGAIKCGGLTITQGIADATVIAWLADVISNPNNQRKLAKLTQAADMERIRSLRAELAQISADEAALMASGVGMNILLAKGAELQQQREAAQGSLTALEQSSALVSLIVDLIPPEPKHVITSKRTGKDQSFWTVGQLRANAEDTREKLLRLPIEHRRMVTKALADVTINRAEHAGSSTAHAASKRVQIESRVGFLAEGALLLPLVVG